MFIPLKFLLDRIVVEGDLEVIDSGGESHRFGDGTGPRVVFVISDAASERRLALDPTLALGEGYMRGTITLREGTVYDLISTVMSNEDQGGFPLAARLPEFLRYTVRRFQQFNPVGRARTNVAHHYDINGAIYDLFLDTDRQYSCGYFRSPSDDLETAQQAKKRHLAAKLFLSPGQRVLDIGSGWGGLAIYLAEMCGAHVTGITLSKEQLTLSRERARRYKGDGTITFRGLDYRRVRSRFDRVVSVGMFEHVGVNHHRTYFRKIERLLEDDGIALIHFIARSDRPAATNPFVAKYIFPGGYIPAMSEVLGAVEHSRLYLTDVEVLRLHYAETLRHWRQRFVAQWDRAAQILDESFCRMWEFYLAGSEAAFRFERLVVVQLQLAKAIDTLPLARDYMAEAEEHLRGAEADLPDKRWLVGE